MSHLALGLALLIAHAAPAPKDAPLTVRGVLHYSDGKPAAALTVLLTLTPQKSNGFDAVATTSEDGSFAAKFALPPKVLAYRLLLAVGDDERTAKVTLKPRQAELWISGDAELKTAPKGPATPMVLGFAGWPVAKADPSALKLVSIPAGSFTMGSPDDEPGRNGNEATVPVTLTVPFEMLATEVTQELYQAVMGTNPSRFLACGPSCPVERVRLSDACTFANRLSALAELPDCYQVAGEGDAATCRVAEGLKRPQDCLGFRLPTEAEWEFAARAGTRTAFYAGDITGSARLLETSECAADATAASIAWFCANSQGRTHPVAGLKPNRWGLYDLSGNVGEWVWGSDGPQKREPATDPVRIALLGAQCWRGGSWYLDARTARSAAKEYAPHHTRSEFIGFRVVRSKR